MKGAARMIISVMWLGWIQSANPAAPLEWKAGSGYRSAALAVPLL